MVSKLACRINIFSYYKLKFIHLAQFQKLFELFLYALLLFAQTITKANAYLSVKINIIWSVNVHVSINKMWLVNPPCKN
jgi:hypothetical protein